MCSIKKVAPKSFTKFTGKHLSQSLFFNKVVTFRPINSIIKQHCSCCIMLIRIDTILSKNIQNTFQNLLFKKLLAQSGDQTDIFWKFYSPADTLWLPKTLGRESQVILLRLQPSDDCVWIFHSSFFIFLPPTELIETRFFQIWDIFYHSFRR